MNMEIDFIRENIKDEIHKKYGKEILYAKDCQELSDLVLEKTHRQISVSTLKRFFGIINSQFKPSKYTLDTLAIFLDFKNWQDFFNSFEAQKHTYSKVDSWEHLRNRIMLITSHSIESYNSKFSKRSFYFPSRAFAEKKMEAFLASSKIATAFIAPDGYGKSTIALQLTNKFFIGENALYPNDIACLVDGRILPKLIQYNPEVGQVQNLYQFDPKRSFSDYFRKNPHEVKGRFILIIDGLNEIFYQPEKLNNFIENLLDIIASYEDIPWFKMVITCKPYIWDIFCKLLNRMSHLKSLWYDVAFDTLLTDTINVPLLEKHEIKDYLAKNHPEISYENLTFHYPEIIDIINNPYFLILFSTINGQENIHTDIELLDQVAYNKILSEPYSTQKCEIIDRLLEQSNLMKKIEQIKKTDLHLKNGMHSAYNDLIDSNILFEYTVPGSYLSVNTFVYFSHSILMEYILANKWIKENDLDLNLIQEIIRYYRNNRQLQQNLLKYIIKIAFKESKTDLLKNIYTVLEYPNNEDPKHEKFVDPEIAKVISVELRKNKEIRDLLIPTFAKSKIGKLCFFENHFDMDSLVIYSGDNIKYYLEENDSDSAKLYGHCLKFMQHFLAGNQEKSESYYQLIRTNGLPQHSNPIYAGLFYGTQIIYQTYFEKKLDKRILPQINQRCDNYYFEGIQPKTSIPNFELLIIFSLNFGNQFSTIIDFANLVLNRYLIHDLSSEWTCQLFLAIYARALLNSNNKKKALEIFRSVEFKYVPVNYKYYVKLRYYLIKAEFQISENKIALAKQTVEEIKTISKMIRFKFFYDQARLLEDIVCPDRHTNPI
ncbi:hypothetical protein ACUNWD_07245 [Sunxiuqinia sp. A32]|uniref:hypothetical protein n=1 Tax=Sunxiuqinia sp. A32 TaxID=3461496 RepID=UPI0040459032